LNTTTFFLVPGKGMFPNFTTVPDSAPFFISSILLVLSSRFSVRSNSAVVRLKAWKSSSSAPASRAVPITTVGSFAGNFGGVRIKHDHDQKYKCNSYLFDASSSPLRDGWFHHKAYNSHRWGRCLCLYFVDTQMRDGLSHRIRNKTQTDKDWSDCWAFYILRDCVFLNRS